MSTPAHPIVDLAVAALERTADGAYHVGPAARARLEVALAEAAAAGQLRPAARELLYFAHYLDSTGSAEAAVVVVQAIVTVAPGALAPTELAGSGRLSEMERVLGDVPRRACAPAEGGVRWWQVR